MPCPIRQFLRGAQLALCTLPLVGPPVVFAQRVAHPLTIRDTASSLSVSNAPAADDSVVTHHSAVIGGRVIAYDAIVGHVTLTDTDGHGVAKVFYTAYVKRDVRDAAHRPITFAYNGGPGAAAVMVQVGAFGPRHVVTADTAALLPPYTIADNQYSILDKTDLVFIDPVGTGYSYLINDGKGKDFWGVDEDVRSLAQFIHRYLDNAQRWNSPKYLAGESYGTARSVVLANYLHKIESIDLNGIILVSCVFNFGQEEDRDYILNLPTYAAIAWYHHVRADRPAELQPLLGEVEQFAITEYATALLAGSTITSTQRASVLDKLERYTGISRSYWEQHNLRVDADQFETELLHQHGEIIGRFDARFAGPPVPGLVGGDAYDPGYNIINPVLETGYRHYLRTELQYKTDRLPDPGVGRWDYQHKDALGRTTSSVAGDLTEALIRNPRLQVLVNSGLYDLATPYFGTKWSIERLNLPTAARARIHEMTYDAGHMMYINPPSLDLLKHNIATFIDSTSGVEEASMTGTAIAH